MLKIFKQAFLVCLLALLGNFAFAQSLTIKGKVTSEADKMALPGATVSVEGTNSGTITNVDGTFELKGVPKSGTLVVSFLGYEEKTVAIDPSKTVYNVALGEQTSTLEEVVVVGYGQMQKKEITGAVSRVTSETLSQISTSDVSSALQGQIAGVNVQASSGEPGSTANIQIRGISSINGGNGPLYVVDGIPQSGDPGLSASEIASFDVLKDAASSAVYGTRGAGGVILITTKEGKKGEMRVNLDGYYGVQHITSGIELMNREEFMYVKLLTNRYITGNNDDHFWTSLETSPQNFTKDFNLMDIVQNDNAAVQNYSLSMSGGNGGVTYSIVGNYFNQEGTIMNSSFERYNVRSNTQFKKGKWSVTTNLGLKIEDKTSPSWGLLSDAYKYNPTQGSIDPNAEISNPGGMESELNSFGGLMAKFKEENNVLGYTTDGNIQVNLDIMKGLSAFTRFGASFGSTKSISIKPLFELYNDDGELVNNTSMQSSVKNNQANSTSMAWESGVNYSLKVGKHDFRATGVFSMEQYSYSSFFGQIKDLATNDVTNLGGGTGEVTVGVGTGQWGQDRANSLIGMMLRAQYNYDYRYMFSASIRRDGSSRFTPSNRWGYFPSVSAGWNIAEENFWNPIKKVASQMKLRASLGTTGNQNFADYSYASTVVIRNDYAFGSGDDELLSYGAIQTAYANANVKWETTQQYNVGLDMGFFDNKLTATLDLYQSNKRDMLFPLLLPSSTGAAGNSPSIILNVGDMVNKGVEFAVGTRNNIGKLQYNVNLTYSKNSNTITKMSATSERSYFSDGAPVSGVGGATIDNMTAVALGYEAGAFFVYETNGIINTEAKLAEYQKFQPTAKMGDLIYIDQNGDNVLNEDDKVYGGSGSPEHELGLNLGLNYKGFDFSAMIYSSIGNEIINGTKMYSYYYNTNTDLLNQWTPVNPFATIPLNRGVAHNNYRSSADIWVEDGSFARLKNVSLGYSLPKKAINAMNLTKFRVYVAADNLFTITSYEGYDPEVGGNGLSKKGIDSGTYPVSSNIRLGVQLAF